jgi:hypothetical protein
LLKTKNLYNYSKHATSPKKGPFWGGKIIKYRFAQESLNSRIYMRLSYIDFWAKDANDTRSQITVKDCLTFTSGYGFGLTKMDLCEVEETFYDCVKRQYGKFEHKYVPGN